MTTSNSTPPRHFPNRDQLSVITAVILLAYALSRFVQLPTRQVEIEFIGIVFRFLVSGQVVMLALVALLIATGADALMRNHPAAPQRSPMGPLRLVIHWVLPGTTALGLGVLLNSPQIANLWWLGLVLSALILLAVLIAEYVAIDRRDAAYGVALLGLSALTYLIALVLFGWMKFSGARASLLAGSTAVIAMLLSLRLLNLRASASPRMLANSAMVGLVVGQMMWAINYWPVSPVGAGLILLVVFYTTHGLAQQNVTLGPNRRVTLEYLGIGAVGLVLAASYAIWG